MYAAKIMKEKERKLILKVKNSGYPEQAPLK
jgi:hypothetical protein